MNRKLKWVYLIVGVVVLTLLDQISKMWAVATLKDKPAIVLLQNVMELRYLENRGAAFGILQGRAIPLLLFTCILAVIIIYIFWKMPEDKKYMVFGGCLIFLLAGAFGNMIDRFLNQYVVDFIYFRLIDFPTFNVADCYVTVSVAVIAVIYLFVFKDEDMDFLKRK